MPARSIISCNWCQRKLHAHSKPKGYCDAHCKKQFVTYKQGFKKKLASTYELLAAHLVADIDSCIADDELDRAKAHMTMLHRMGKVELNKLKQTGEPTNERKADRALVLADADGQAKLDKFLSAFDD